MQKYNILVTGAFSGIGKEFVRAYLENPSNYIFAIDKDVPSEALHSADAKYAARRKLEEYRNDIGDPLSGDAMSGRVAVSGMDITEEASVAHLDALRGLEIVIHCAGVRGLVPSVSVIEGSDVAGAETMDVMTSKTMLQTFRTNSMGTFLLIRAVVPVLRSNGGKAVIMGSRMGSIGHNITGGGYAYRASKAALNALVKSFSVDVPEACFAIVHPGRVESNLVGAGVREDGAITAEESVKDMLQLISRFRREDSGRFTDRFGDNIEW